MAYHRKSAEEPRRRRAPAKDPETRELQLISAATDLAERQIIEGTASATVITHYLKLGSQRERLEREKLTAENDLLRAKVDTLSSQKKVEELFEEAIKAMRAYQGAEVEEDHDYDY